MPEDFHGESIIRAHPAESAPDLWALCAQVQQCQLCPLCKTRTNPVFGEGSPHAELMFIGEGPGRDEDRLGRPFVGRAGQLLDRMIAAMQFTRQEVFIANVVKCRPPDNRTPMPDEGNACRRKRSAADSRIAAKRRP